MQFYRIINAFQNHLNHSLLRLKSLLQKNLWICTPIISLIFIMFSLKTKNNFEYLYHWYILIKFYYLKS